VFQLIFLWFSWEIYTRRWRPHLRKHTRSKQVARSQTNSTFHFGWGYRNWYYASWLTRALKRIPGVRSAYEVKCVARGACQSHVAIFSRNFPVLDKARSAVLFGHCTLCVACYDRSVFKTLRGWFEPMWQPPNIASVVSSMFAVQFLPTFPISCTCISLNTYLNLLSYSAAVLFNLFAAAEPSGNTCVAHGTLCNDSNIFPTFFIKPDDRNVASMFYHEIIKKFPAEPRLKNTAVYAVSNLTLPSLGK